jgi:hypothetical protein
MDIRHSPFGLRDNKLVEITAVRVVTNTIHCGQTRGLLQVSEADTRLGKTPFLFFVVALRFANGRMPQSKALLTGEREDTVLLVI